MLIKVQCVIYQLIHLNKLYKHLKNFFKFHFQNLLQLIKIIVALCLRKRGGGSICVEQHAF